MSTAPLRESAVDLAVAERNRKLKACDTMVLILEMGSMTLKFYAGQNDEVELGRW